MMQTSGYFGYQYYNNMQVLSLDYEGDSNIKMLIIIPTKKHDLKNLMQILTGKRLLEIANEVYETKLDMVILFYLLKINFLLTNYFIYLFLSNILKINRRIY